MSKIKILYTALGAAFAFAIAVLLLPEKIIGFKNYFPEAREYIYSFLYKPEAWTGVFDKYPEGLVDMASLGISTDVDAALELDVVEGNRLDGRIWWLGSCSFGGPYSGLLIDGRINAGGSSAEVTIWELVGGYRKDLAHGVLEINGIMITFGNFPQNLGLNGSRIAKNPEPSKIEDWPDLHCY